MVPEAYYKFSRDFDYRQYLEDKSHTDRIVLSLDNASKAIIGGADVIAKRIGHGAVAINNLGRDLNDGFHQVDQRLGAISGALEKGFDQIAVELGDLTGNVDRLNTVCTLGFDTLNISIGESNDLLSEIADLLKTPDQVWAKEQFSYAAHCVENGLSEEALEYCTKAIHGDDLHNGYKIAPAFYFLRGRIYLGELGATATVDLEKAEDDFLKCVTYCAEKRLDLKGRALVLLAWTRYCRGELTTAVKALEEAYRLGPTRDSGEVDFLLAKVQLQLRERHLAKKHFQLALVRDELYAVRAVNDPVFQPHLQDVLRWAEETRRELADQVAAFVTSKLAAKGLIRLADLAQSQKVQFDGWSELSNRLDELASPSELPLALLVRFINHEQVAFREQAKSRALRAMRMLEEKAHHLRTASPTTSVPKPERANINGDVVAVGGGVFAVIGAIIGLVITIIMFLIDEKDTTGVDLVLAWVFGFPLVAAIVSAIGAGVGWVVGLAVGFIKDSLRRSSENARHSASRRRAVEERNREEQAIAEGREHEKRLSSDIESLKADLAPLLA